MSRTKELAKSVGSTLTSQAATTVLSIAFFAYFGRVLPKSDLALFAFLGTMSSWIVLVSGFGMGGLTVREVPTYVATGRLREAHVLITSTLVYQAVAAFGVMLVLFRLAPFLSEQVFDTVERTGQMRLLCVVGFVQSLAQTLSLMQWALQRFHIRALSSALTGIGSRVVAFVGYLLGGIEGFVMGFGGVAVIVIAFHLWTLRRELVGELLGVRRMLRQSRPYIGVAVLRNLYMNLDRPLIAFLLGDAALADFFVGKRVYGFCQTSLMGVVSPVGAKIAEVRAEGSRALTAYFRKGLYLVAVLFIPCGCALIGMSEQILVVLVGPKYEGSATILSMFGFMLVAQSIYCVWYEGVYRLRSGYHVMLLNATVALSTFGLYGVLFPILGAAGIPVAGACGTGIGAMVGAYLVRRHLVGVSAAGLYVRAAGCGLAVWGTVWTLSSRSHSVSGLAVTLLAGGVVYGSSFVVLAPPEARSMLDRVWRRLRGSASAG